MSVHFVPLLLLKAVNVEPLVRLILTQTFGAMHLLLFVLLAFPLVQLGRIQRYVRFHATHRKSFMVFTVR